MALSGVNMGLLDNFGGNLDDPKTQAMLALGLGLLNSRGNFGQGLGQAGTQAMGAYADAKKQKQLQEFQQVQMDDMRQQALLRQQQAARAEAQLKEATAWRQPAQIGQGLPSIMPGSGQRSQAENAQVQQSVQPQQSGLPPGVAAYAGMPLEQLRARMIAGLEPKEAPELWQMENFGKTVQPGWNMKPGQQPSYLPNLPQGMTVSGGAAQNMPGFVGAQSEAAGANAGATTAAQEAAKAPYSFVDTYTDGKPGKVPLSSLVPPPKQAGPGRIPPAAQQAANVDALQMIDAEIAKTTPGPVLDGLKRERGKLAMTGSPTGVPGNTASAPGGFVQTGPSQTEKSAASAGDDVNKNWLTTSYTPVLQAGDAARGLLPQIAVARSGLAMAGTTGWGKSAQVAGARVLGALGVDKAEEMATGAQRFQMAASSRLWEVLNAAKGPQTEGDADRAKDTFAKLGNTPKANAFILDLAQATAERDALRATWYKEKLPLGKKEGDLQMLDRKWQEREPSIFKMPSMQKWGQ